MRDRHAAAEWNQVAAPFHAQVGIILLGVAPFPLIWWLRHAITPRISATYSFDGISSRRE
jgi:hypothetical protein